MKCIILTFVMSTFNLFVTKDFVVRKIIHAKNFSEFKIKQNRMYNKKVPSMELQYLLFISQK